MGDTVAAVVRGNLRFGRTKRERTVDTCRPLPALRRSHSGSEGLVAFAGRKCADGCPGQPGSVRFSLAGCCESRVDARPAPSDDHLMTTAAPDLQLAAARRLATEVLASLKEAF